MMALGITSETLKNVLKLRTPVLRDCFTSKYITAQIFDETGGWHAVPLIQRYMHNDHVFVKLGEKIILLKVDMQRIHTYRQSMSRPIQTLLYTTRDYMPFDPADEKTIEVFCKKNGITKLGPTQSLFIHAASMLEEKDKKGNFVTDSIRVTEVVNQLVSTLSPESKGHATRVAELQNAASTMGAIELMSPIKPMSDILDRKMHNNPEALFSSYQSLKNLNFEWKKIANPAKTPFGHWALVLLIMGMIGVVGIVAYAFDAGLVGGNSGNALDELLEKSKQFIDPDAYLDDKNSNGTSAEKTAEELAAITEDANKIDVPIAVEIPAVVDVPVVKESVNEIPTTEVPVVVEIPAVTETVTIEPNTTSGIVDVPVTEEPTKEIKVEVPVIPKLDTEGIIQYFNKGDTGEWVVTSEDAVTIDDTGTLLENSPDDLKDYGQQFPDFSRAHDTPDEIKYYTQGNDTEINHEVTTNNDELNEILKKESIVEQHYHDNFNPESGLFDKPDDDITTKNGTEFVQDFN